MSKNSAISINDIPSNEPLLRKPLLDPVDCKHPKTRIARHQTYGLICRDCASRIPEVENGNM
jgi:hypothetical protein